MEYSFSKFVDEIQQLSTKADFIANKDKLDYVFILDYDVLKKLLLMGTTIESAINVIKVLKRISKEKSITVEELVDLIPSYLTITKLM